MTADIRRYSRVFHGFATGFFLLGVCTLVWRRGNIMNAVLKPSEMFFFLTAICVGIIFIFALYEKSVVETLKKTFLRIRIPLALLVLGIIVGHVYSIFALPQWHLFRTEVLLEYSRILFVIILFFTTAYIAASRPGSVRWMLFAISLSSLILWIALLPRFQSLMVIGGRLRGPESDPNYLGSWLALGFVLDVCFFLYMTRWARWLGLIAGFCTPPLIIWTGSRSSALAACFSVLIAVIFYLTRGDQLRKRIISAIVLFAILGLSLVFALHVIPRESSLMIQDRLITPSLTGHNIFYGQSRGELFIEGTKKLLRFPLGFGPAYVNWQPLEQLSDGRIQGPHNLFLEIGLTGGVLSLVAFLFLLAFFIKQCITFTRHPTPVRIGLAMGLLAVLINCLFLDTLTLRWLWILFGAVFALSSLTNLEPNR